MDIERLTKVQIVMLTLLVSFVTSIATGIVTVSLMDQAPPSIEQTVNRVIERTIQTVVPSSSQTGSAAVVTQEKTVVVNDSDLIAEAIKTISPSIVKLYTTDSQSATFIGLGVVVDASGTIAADIGSLGQNADAVIQTSSGARVRAFVRVRDDASGVAFLESATSTMDGATTSWTPVGITAARVSLGETIVTIAGNSITRVNNGIVSSVAPPAKDAPLIIDTNLSDNSISAGSPLFGTSGELIGFSTSVSRASAGSAFVSAAALIRSSGN